ncbi:RNAse M5 [Streptohalobacillus salinus]|uniref:Ribonuclease M5 n=1 Tax=Streptohalobacillus salinus TaxID=621096 RepID=A0A2V3W442_9BACI|nr:ribonuclease M5 [Streptohalobacillus salinus]PXW88476.1 RNAse M5 [Streptohalobacillus salinus]
MRIKEVIVVEGKDDTQKIKQAVEADTIETNGSAINPTILDQIKHAYEKRGVIVFTDPDYPGQRIRSIVSERVPGVKHAFLTKDEARDKFDRGIGIEHASSAAIRQALAAVYERDDTPYQSEMTRDDLMRYGLIGHEGAKRRRDYVTKQLRIGYCNGKQLLKRLAMFKISKEQLETVVNAIPEEDKHV